MNLLAHAYLGFDEPALVVGQIAGDFVKGSQLQQYPLLIRQGIQMHRKLDSWTDQNRVFRRSCARLGNRKRVAGILIDLAYDHSLARLWSNYAQTQLPEYATFVYNSLNYFSADLPAVMAGFIHRAPVVRLFEHYSEPAGLERGITYVASRFRRPEYFDGAFEEIMSLIREIDDDFTEFFPQAVQRAVEMAPQLHTS